MLGRQPPLARSYCPVCQALQGHARPMRTGGSYYRIRNLYSETLTIWGLHLYFFTLSMLKAILTISPVPAGLRQGRFVCGLELCWGIQPWFLLGAAQDYGESQEHTGRAQLSHPHFQFKVPPSVPLLPECRGGGDRRTHQLRWAPGRP